MILSFKNQFPEKILSGSKIHSIREDPHGRWKPGRKIHMATGVRTKKYHCFKESVCVSVQIFTIYLDQSGSLVVWIDGHKLQVNEIKNLTINDGFGSIKDFRQWFHSDFQGRIIHWTDLKY